MRRKQGFHSGLVLCTEIGCGFNMYTIIMDSEANTNQGISCRKAIFQLASKASLSENKIMSLTSFTEVLNVDAVTPLLENI